MLTFLVGEAARDLRRAGRVGLSAILLITLSLAALGCFWLLSLNLGQAVAQWRERVRIVGYLREEPRLAAVDDFLARVQALDGVQRVRFVSRAEALSSLKRSLAPRLPWWTSSRGIPCPPPSRWCPPRPRRRPKARGDWCSASPPSPRSRRCRAAPNGWTASPSGSGCSSSPGSGVGAVLALAAILTVTTATTLVLHARRDEMEIMRLVGATETVIRLPLLLQGMAQGLLGAAVALAALVGAHALVAPRVEPLLTLTLGLSRAVFLSRPEMLLLLAGGAMLGALGGLLAKGRAYS